MAIEGAWEVTPRLHPDPRGVFLEGFRRDHLAKEIGHDLQVRQTNISVSAAGALRGVHFADVPPSQAKYVTAVSGVFIDFVVDVRVGSPTFGKWDSVGSTRSTAARCTCPRGSDMRLRASRTGR